MNETLYYVAGVALAVAAVGVSFLGLRQDSFGGSREAFRLLVALMAGLVLVTATGAVLNARSEQKQRRVEVREFEEKQAADGGRQQAGATRE